MIREDILQTKLEKLQHIKDAGWDPYPEKTARTHEAAQILADFEKLENKEVVVAGRIRSLRVMGNAAFAHLEDESGRLQLFFAKANMDAEAFKLFAKNAEMGDFIEARGCPFLTKSGEKSLKIEAWKMLAKNIRPVPTEHFGIKDEEELLRRRYLDLLTSGGTRELFRKKSVFWQTVRSVLAKEGFLEVQTPVLEHVPGGADAEPFVTHHNALDQDFYMRISLELALKRLLVGGYEKVFEIGRVFRNEGIDRQHLQEFDHMEFYAAYWDLEKGMKFSENLFRKTALAVLGSYEHRYGEQIIDWSKSFPKVDYFEAFQKETGINLSEEVSLQQLQAKAEELEIKYDPAAGKGKMIDTIYKKTVRQKMIQPCLLVGHPIEVSPLAKKDPSNPKRVLRFQVVAGTAELCNAFAELNDPLDQRERFEQQMKLREAGDAEAQMFDEDFVEALEYGMPPAFGFGFSERFFSFLMNRSIRETVIFPPMKNKE
ncbi:MAG TPA: lysine--tRNA ligase [Candidatus Moranbacteria bacterium]|nr:lysine--tRNA ligase [Candidatus Moranbacteria bacterium]